ncbi:MAG: enoyl-CoA hydratase/isomerase family protein [Pseudomonadales bacterium]
MSEPLVTREDVDGLSILSLNRPEVLNALSPSLFVELRNHIDALAKQTEQIGCVILQGKGRSFSAGNDLKAIQSGERAPSATFQAETLEAIESLPQPVIAAVQGHCYTGALELALACDLMITADSARIADTHGKWGMSPTWGMSQRLPRRIGLVKARELMFSGRVVSGAEAVEIGLANDCVADDSLPQAATDMARRFLENSWFTLRMDKTLINGGLDRHLSEGIRFERETSPGAGPDTAERLGGFGKTD